VQQVHRYLARTGDEDFVRRLWPNIQDAMKYAAFLDSDGDGVVNEHAHALPGDNWPANQFYDQWPGTARAVTSPPPAWPRWRRWPPSRIA
jgi:glycogen debranching enzyme